MPAADENVRVPVVVANLRFSWRARRRFSALAALNLPAAEFDLGELITKSLFNAPHASEVVYATILCAVLGLLQTAAIRDPDRGTPRYKFGIALAVLALVSGLVVAHAHTGSGSSRSRRSNRARESVLTSGCSAGSGSRHSRLCD